MVAFKWILVVQLQLLCPSEAFVVNRNPAKSAMPLSLNAQKDQDETILHQQQQQQQQHRRSFLQKLVTTSTAAASTLLLLPTPSQALVKGNAPPPKKSSAERKCVNVEECQEMAERLASQQDEEMRLNQVPSKVTAKGTRYRDVIDAPDNGTGALVLAKPGDEATVRYKVLKLGKRSYDGLSGEGTVVFSRGYGLEDDEDKAGVKSFVFNIGDASVIGALNDAVVGMNIGTTRRLAILPQMGWEKPETACDGGPGGKGAGGEIKTDYVVVPTATMVATEICFDKSKRPFPSTYAEQRRMAQRFDQSLIMEVELVGLKS